MYNKKNKVEYDLIPSFNYVKYVSRQYENFFPDGKRICNAHLQKAINNSLQRLEYCFKRIKLRGFDTFSHLHTDQYAMFLYILSNELFSTCENIELASKTMYLNKALHAVNCMYDNILPSPFLFIHIVGAVIGKAKFGNYSVFAQGVTIGSNNGIYPIFGNNIIFHAHSYVIGECNVGSNVTFGSGVRIRNITIPDNTVALLDKAGNLQILKARKDYSDIYFIK
jgi:serine O-acetyltransferase